MQLALPTQIMGSMMASFAEGLALAEGAGLSQQDLIDVTVRLDAHALQPGPAASCLQHECNTAVMAKSIRHCIPQGLGAIAAPMYALKGPSMQKGVFTQNLTIPCCYTWMLVSC